MKRVQQKLSHCRADVTPTSGMLLITAHLVDHFWKFPLFRKWEKGMDINPEDETYYTTQYLVVFLKSVENEYCTRHRCVPGIKPDSIPSNNFSLSTMGAESGQSSFNSYYLSSDDEEY